MTIAELRTNLTAILQAEDQPEVDWYKVEGLCGETLRRLNTEFEPDYPYQIVYHFLDDTDVREVDPRYARVQRERLRAWLSAA